MYNNLIVRSRARAGRELILYNSQIRRNRFIFFAFVDALKMRKAKLYLLSVKVFRKCYYNLVISLVRAIKHASFRSFYVSTYSLCNDLL